MTAVTQNNSQWPEDSLATLEVITPPLTGYPLNPVGLLAALRDSHKDPLLMMRWYRTFEALITDLASRVDEAVSALVFSQATHESVVAAFRAADRDASLTVSNWGSISEPDGKKSVDMCIADRLLLLSKVDRTLAAILAAHLGMVNDSDKNVNKLLLSGGETTGEIEAL